MQTAPTRSSSSPAPASGATDVARLLVHHDAGTPAARRLVQQRDGGSAALLELDAGDELPDAGQGVVSDGGAALPPSRVDAGVDAGGLDSGQRDAGRSSPCKLYLCAGVCQPWPCP